MSSKIIALRKRSRLQLKERVAASVEEKRAAMMERSAKASAPERLMDMGLMPIEPDETEPTSEHCFEALIHLDGYVIQTDDPERRRRAMNLLEEEYMFMPDWEMEAPLPEHGRQYARRPPSRQGWPEITGIDAAHRLGVKGKDVMVWILDTGVDADHLELRDKVIDFRYVPPDTTAGRMRDCRGFDVDGHGTHVAGILAGKNYGVAPDVDLMVAAVLDSETLKTSLERVVVALDWLLSQFEEEQNLDKPVVLNMSLGFSRRTLSRRAFRKAAVGLQMVIDTLVNDFAVLPITATGNEGIGEVRAPAYFANTLSVGAVDWELNVPQFSSSGVSPITKEHEPNLVGFGVDVVSSYERDRHNRSLYRAMSGSSMATPYVAGIAALYACCGRMVQGTELAQQLLRTALPLPNAPKGRAGAGLARFVQEAIP